MANKVYILHENPEWVEAYSNALSSLDVEFEFWNLAQGSINFQTAPPIGVFYVRISASSHDRGNLYAADYARYLVAWLESHGRRVINGSDAVNLELSKANQYAALKKAGVPVPDTIIAVGHEQLCEVMENFPRPFVLKPNRGGKGAGVTRIDTQEELNHALAREVDISPDGAVVVQQYIDAHEPYIIRNEFVAGEHLYSVRVNTEDGFELCPADFCNIDPEAKTKPKFEILQDFKPEYLRQYSQVLKEHAIEIAGVEMITSKSGKTFTYDINVNTNYNTLAESQAGLDKTGKTGLMSVCRFLAAELAILH